MATRAIPAVTTRPVSLEKSERVASELALVRRVQRGDEEAFATLFQLHRKRVYSVCLSMTRDASEAEDLTQEAFLQVFRNVRTFRGDSAFSTWLYRLTVNIVLLKHRRHKSPPMLSLDAPASSDSPSLRHELCYRDPHLSGAIDRITLHRAIDALPPGYRTIFGFMRFTGTSIARSLNCYTARSTRLSRNFTMRGSRCGTCCFPSGVALDLEMLHASRTRAPPWRRRTVANGSLRRQLRHPSWPRCRGSLGGGRVLCDPNQLSARSLAFDWSMYRPITSDSS